MWARSHFFVDALADFLSGRISNASIALGDPDRQVFVNTWDLFAEDAWQVTPKLNVNFGLRWDYEGPLHNNEEPIRFSGRISAERVSPSRESRSAISTIRSTPTSARASALSYQVRRQHGCSRRRGSLL